MAQRLCNRRPKKFLGAVIGAATGLAGSIIGGIEQNNAAKRQVKQQKYDAALQSAASLNQAYSGDSDYSKSFNDRYSLEFGNGGYIHAQRPALTRSMYQLVNNISNSGTNFAGRLNEQRLRTIPINNNMVASHKMSYSNDEYGYYVYPEVQELNGKITDLSSNRKVAHDSARNNGDYVRVNNEDEARLFTEHYKEYYPSFNRFDSSSFNSKTRKTNNGYGGGKTRGAGAGSTFGNSGAGSTFGNGGLIAVRKGGIAQPIGGGLSLLRGRKHTDGGIDIDVANKKIEAEAGEVLQPTTNGLRIFSAKSMPGIGVPAKEVIDNPSASDSIFAQQQLYKQRNGLTDSGKKKAFGDYLGIKRKFDSSSEEAFTKDVKGYAAKKEMGQQIGDMTATAVNIATPIVSGLFGMSAAKKLQNPARPTLYRAANLKTDYNVNPQLAEIDKNQYRADAEIDSNTISSVAGLARKQRVGVEALGQRNTLLGQKENIETELQNNAALNRQQTDNQNTAALNDYNNRLAETENNRSAIRVNSLNGMLSGLAGAGRDYQSRLDARKEKNDTLKAIVAGDSTNSTAVMMKKGAFDANPDALMAFMNSSDPEIAAEAKRRMGYTGKSSYTNPKNLVLNSPIKPTNRLSTITNPNWNKLL